MKIAKNNLKIWFIGLIFLLNSQASYANKMFLTKADEYINISTPFYNENGEKLYFDNYEDKTILVIFWATWCGACTETIRSLDYLQKDFRKLPFKIIMLSEDDQGADIPKSYFKENEIRFLELFHDKKNGIFKELLITGMPNAYLIAPNSKLKLKIKGQVKWHENEIRRLILDEIPGEYEMPRNTYVPAPALNRVIQNGSQPSFNNESIENKDHTSGQEKTNNNTPKTENKREKNDRKSS